MNKLDGSKVVKFLTSGWAKATYDFIGGVVAYYCGYMLINVFSVFTQLTEYQALPGIMIIAALILFVLAGMLVSRAGFRIYIEVHHV